MTAATFCSVRETVRGRDEIQNRKKLIKTRCSIWKKGTEEEDERYWLNILRETSRCWPWTKAGEGICQRRGQMSSRCPDAPLSVWPQMTPPPIKSSSVVSGGDAADWELWAVLSKLGRPFVILFFRFFSLEAIWGSVSVSVPVSQVFLEYNT